jgi:hypothetical protein
MENVIDRKKFTFDIRWVGLGFCLFVVMHLLPAYLIYYLRIVTPAAVLVYAIWLFAGIAFVAFFIGYKSRGVTIVEVSIAGVLYSFVLLAAVHSSWETPIEMANALWIYSILVIATLGAYVGELVQSWDEKKTKRGAG